ncbi:HAD-IA family hydrolase [Streptomyces sp. NPDC002324]
MEAILFDVDGVLIDSGAAHERVWKAWAERRELDPDHVFAVTQGKRRVDTLRALAPHRSEDEENELLNALMAKEEASIRAYSGVSALLRDLAPDRWAVVTSSRGDAIVRRFEAEGLPVPAVRICAENVPEGKPSPLGYLAAAKALAVDPAACVVVEDSPAGVEAGLAAGCTVYAVASTRPAEQLRKAHVTYESFDQIADRLREGTNSWLTSPRT